MTRPVWAVADQVVISAAHFIIGFSVARSGDALALGLFGIAVIAVGACSDLHRAVVWLPMTHAPDTAHFRIARRLSLLLAIGFGSAAGLLGLMLRVTGRDSAAPVAGLLAVLIPVLLFHEIHRRIQFARLNTIGALAADLTYLVGAIAAIFVLPGVAGVTSQVVLRALVAWTAAGMVGSTVGTILLRGLPATNLSVGRLARQYWPAGRAYLVNAGLIFGSQRVSMLIIASALGTAALGNVEAARLLTAPIMVAALGLASVTVPGISRAVRDHGLRRAQGAADRIAVIALVVAILFGTAACVGADAVARAAFGQTYDRLGSLTFIYSGIAGTSLAATAMIALLGIANPWAIPMSRVPGMVTVLMLAYPVALRYGELGVLSLVLAEGAITFLLLRRAAARLPDA